MMWIELVGGEVKVRAQIGWLMGEIHGGRELNLADRTKLITK
jgi:hypothetical protein